MVNLYPLNPALLLALRNVWGAFLSNLSSCVVEAVLRKNQESDTLCLPSYAEIRGVHASGDIERVHRSTMMSS